MPGPFGWLGLSETREWSERDFFDSQTGRQARELTSSGPDEVQIWTDLATGQVLHITTADSTVVVESMEDLPVVDKSLCDWQGQWRHQDSGSPPHLE